MTLENKLLYLSDKYVSNEKVCGEEKKTTWSAVLSQPFHIRTCNKATKTFLFFGARIFDFSKVAGFRLKAVPYVPGPGLILSMVYYSSHHRLKKNQPKSAKVMFREKLFTDFHFSIKLLHVFHIQYRLFEHDFHQLAYFFWEEDTFTCISLLQFF